MIDLSVSGWARVAAVGVLVAAVGLATSGCGRKGPLDPPPSAAHYSPEPAPAGPAQPALDGQIGVDRDGRAVAPPPSQQRQPFILDWLVE